MRWASLSGSVEGKPVRQLWLKHGEGEDLQSIENLLKPVQSMAICISLSYAGINLQPLQAKAGGRCQALVPWQPPTPCHDAEVTQASSQAESFVKFPTGTPCSRGGGGPAETTHHRRLADAVSSFLARRGPFLSERGVGTLHGASAEERGPCQHCTCRKRALLSFHACRYCSR